MSAWGKTGRKGMRRDKSGDRKTKPAWAGVMGSSRTVHGRQSANHPTAPATTQLRIRQLTDETIIHLPIHPSQLKKQTINYTVNQ